MPQIMTPDKKVIYEVMNETFFPYFRKIYEDVGIPYNDTYDNLTTNDAYKELKKSVLDQSYVFKETG